MLRRLAVLAYHSSPLAEPGAGDGGGMTVYVRALARALARRGVLTDIFTRATASVPRAVELAPGVRVLCVDAGRRCTLPKEELIAHIDDFVSGVHSFGTSQRVAYELVHSHYWQSGLAGRSLARAWGVPLVHSSHTLGRVKNGSLAPGDLPEPARRIRAEAEVIAAADALVTSTGDERDQVCRLYGAARELVKVVHPGVDHQLFSPGDKATARAGLGLAEHPVLLFVGRIQPLKGLALAIQTLARLVALLDPPPVLVVVGGASGTNGDAEIRRLDDLARSLGVAESVRFAGPQPHTTLPIFYRAADAVVICSHSESFGLAALEAQACGTPVVGASVGGLSHVVRDGRSGFLLSERDPALFAQRLQALLSDRELQRSFSREASRVARRFSWDKSAAEMLELYECLAETFPERRVC